MSEFDRLISVNLRGMMLCYKYAAIQMIAQGRGGRIIGMFPAAFKTRSTNENNDINTYTLTGASSAAGKQGKTEMNLM